MTRRCPHPLWLLLLPLLLHAAPSTTRADATDHLGSEHMEASVGWVTLLGSAQSCTGLLLSNRAVVARRSCIGGSGAREARLQLGADARSRGRVSTTPREELVDLDLAIYEVDGLSVSTATASLLDGRELADQTPVVVVGFADGRRRILRGCRVVGDGDAQSFRYTCEAPIPSGGTVIFRLDGPEDVRVVGLGVVDAIDGDGNVVTAVRARALLQASTEAVSATRTRCRDFNLLYRADVLSCPGRTVRSQLTRAGRAGRGLTFAGIGLLVVSGTAAGTAQYYYGRLDEQCGSAVGLPADQCVPDNSQRTVIALRDVGWATLALGTASLATGIVLWSKGRPESEPRAATSLVPSFACDGRGCTGSVGGRF